MSFDDSQNDLEAVLANKFPEMAVFSDIQIAEVIDELQVPLSNPSGQSNHATVIVGYRQESVALEVNKTKRLDFKHDELYSGQSNQCQLPAPENSNSDGDSDLGASNQKDIVMYQPNSMSPGCLIQDKETLFCEENFYVEPKSIPGTDFQVKIAKHGKDIHYFYSDILKMYYAGTKNPLTYEMTYVKNPSLPRDLVVRVYWVIPSKLYKRLSRSRCTNECHKADTLEPVNHIVTLEQGGPAEYTGTPDGASPKDRLALVIPMGESARKSIVLKFRCLSSCSNASKSPTALVFTLVDPVRGHLFGRETIPIKVTMNVGRDMKAAERAFLKQQQQPSGPGHKRKQLPSPEDLAGPSCSVASENPDWCLFKIRLPCHSVKFVHEAYKSEIARAMIDASEPYKKLCVLALAEMEKQAADVEKSKRM